MKKLANEEIIQFANFLIFSLATACLSAAQVVVSTPEEIYAAVDRALNDGCAAREIVLKKGAYFLPRTIELRGSAASNFTFRAEKPGEAVLYGGVPLRDWTREQGTPFYSAVVPDWTPERSVPFRLLVKNGEWAPISTLPGGTNRFVHLAKFEPTIMSSLAGGWSRQPTDEEYQVMPYRLEDVGDAVDLENADIRLYHMWNDSLCTVLNVDRAAHVLRVRERPKWAMGAANRRSYEVLNVREGLREPGQWYLDRKAGRVHYWPKQGENVEKLLFVVPRLKHVFRFVSDMGRNRKKGPCGVTVRDLTISACAPDLSEQSSFGGSRISAAVDASGVEMLRLENLIIRNVGGSGIGLHSAGGCRIVGCDVSFTGAAGLDLDNYDGGIVASNRVADVGQVYRGSCGVRSNGLQSLYCGNEICRTPYCGLIGGGSDNQYLCNFIHHVMQVLHDGGAVYGNLTRCLLKGNVVRDIVSNGPGFGVHAYYPDENSRDCVVEGNYSEGVMSPIHNHMTLRTVVRNNTFVNRGDLSVSFSRSILCTFSNNTLICSGKLSVKGVNGAPNWGGNVAVRPADPADPASRNLVGEWRPERTRQKPKPEAKANRAAKPPVLDGVFTLGEWPVKWLTLDRTPDGYESGFSTANVRFSWDDDFLYASMMTANFRNSPMRTGKVWGEDDGVELVVGDVRVRAFFSGCWETLPANLAGVRGCAGRDPDAVKNARANQNIGHYEFAIPWKTLGLVPKQGLTMTFNVFAYVSEFGQLKCWDAPSSGSIRLIR